MNRFQQRRSACPSWQSGRTVFSVRAEREGRIQTPRQKGASVPGLNVLRVLAIVFTFSLGVVYAQEKSGQDQLAQKGEPDPSGVIVIGPPQPVPPPPVLYRASAKMNAVLNERVAKQVIDLAIDVVQGEAQSVRFSLIGTGTVTNVTGEGVLSYSVRRAGKERFLELQVDESLSAISASVKIDSAPYRLPANVTLTHLGPAEAVGFNLIAEVQFAEGVSGKVAETQGFLPIGGSQNGKGFQTTSGGKLQFQLQVAGVDPAPVELSDVDLKGRMAKDRQSIEFEWTATANVNQAGAKIELLRGDVALAGLPEHPDVRIRLLGKPKVAVYEAEFLKVGVTNLKVSFVARVAVMKGENFGTDFSVASGPVVPLKLDEMEQNLTFYRDGESISPERDVDSWVGFLPASGRVRLQWKSERTTVEGKLFFSTTGLVETTVGSGLLRQEHSLAYQVLQGELDTIGLQMRGPGEILDVKGEHVVAWGVSTDGDERRLDITLGQPISGSASVVIRSQNALGAFPLKVEGMSIEPIGAIRHSGFLRISNVGSVRLEPVDLAGLTQLAPEQFAGEAINARQVYVYRFPSASHSFSVTADRVQPEVNLSELVQYQLGETERVILSDIELDIREAAIREWRFEIPEDYSVVAVTGANVADYLVESEVIDQRRDLKVIFGQDVMGRQLINLHLEKSSPAKVESWVLPKIEHPDAKSVRGDIGIVGSPGYRLAVESIDLLVEKSLAYFPKPSVNLQQAFRIREPGWAATMAVERLDRSIQSDVFHLFSLSEEHIYGSALITYFITGAPVSELKIRLPEYLKNEVVDGYDVQDSRRSGDVLTVTLHQPVMGPYTLLVTFEEKPKAGKFSPGEVTPLGVQGERGFIQVVSPMQVEMDAELVSDGMLALDSSELPNELRLLSSAPSLGTWQYTERPFELELKVSWFQPGSTVGQVVDFAEVESRISQDGELVTELLYFVKSRGQRSLKLQLPEPPVRLWEASVNDEPVNARDAGEFTLIPLPGGIDPDIPVEVRLRLGKPTVRETRPVLTLPIVFAPVLKTEWTVVGDDRRMIAPANGTVMPPDPILQPTGFEWITQNAMSGILGCLILPVLAIMVRLTASPWRHLGALMSIGAVYLAITTAMVAGRGVEYSGGLSLSLPILSSGDSVYLEVYNHPLWRANFSIIGLLCGLLGIVSWVASVLTRFSEFRTRLKVTSGFLFMVGLLLQHDSGAAFFWVIAIVITWFVSFSSIVDFWKAGISYFGRASDIGKGAPVSSGMQNGPEDDRNDLDGDDSASGPEGDGTEPGGSSGIGAGLATLIFLLASLPFSGSWAADSVSLPGDALKTADSIVQSWSVSPSGERLLASGSLTVTGLEGDRFLLLRSPGVLTHFKGTGLKLTKNQDAGGGLVYTISILPEGSNQPNAVGGDEGKQQALVNDQQLETSVRKSYTAEFSYQNESINFNAGVSVLTSEAAVKRLRLQHHEGDRAISCTNAIRVDSVEDEESGITTSNLLLGVGPSAIRLIARERDVKAEATRFFVETSNLYLPRPGVVDGRHRFDLRTAQGVIDSLSVEIPTGLTVSEVSGPVGSWQFDPDQGKLSVEITPVQSQPFSVMVETQRGLDSLPTDLTLSPLKILNADGEVGLLALAFDSDSQPEKLEPADISPVNLGDFDPSMLDDTNATLYRVYRYGSDGGEVKMRVAPIAAEVRVISEQVLSLDDERVVLSVNLMAEITRSGLFNLSFALPDGFEVESLSGPALHHWSELTEAGERQVVMHLNGKTLGPQSFAVTLVANTPDTSTDWTIPRFQLNEALRQSGDLVVQPDTGIRLRSISRQNVSEVDPRVLGSSSQGALAFRLLQTDWNLVIGIEKLEARISGVVLLETDLREGQTRSVLIGDFEVQNASVRSMMVKLPMQGAMEMKPVRVTGAVVSDFVVVDEAEQLWELQFKRRVLGRVSFRIEFERRGDRVDGEEKLHFVEFPDAGQVGYFFAVRAGGRLEVDVPEIPTGWTKMDWSSVPNELRDSSFSKLPVVVMRAQGSAEPLVVTVQRHSLADALKLRVAQGRLLTVLAASGDQLTSVDVSMEVIQRSSLTVGLPKDGEVFSIFVNGESVNSIRVGGDANAWQFYVLPGVDGRTAEVSFVYAVPGDGLGTLHLEGPQLNVPLENIEWSVVAPKGYEMVDNDGNVDLVRQANLSKYDRSSYLRKSTTTLQRKAEQSATTFQQANEYIQKDQIKANRLLNSVVNQHGLDEASNEDARVQLERLQTQRAIVALNTIRQRMVLDNDQEQLTLEGTEQLRQAAEDNPILQQGSLNFQLNEMTQLLGGNTTEDNVMLERIAGRLVQHQRSTEPAQQAIIISLPEEGVFYTFSRSVQVAENAPLELDLEFRFTRDLPFWRSIGLLLSLFGFAGMVVWASRRKKSAG